jgi:oxygen-independent coproporphyrinogen-3 oxidase
VYKSTFEAATGESIDNVFRSKIERLKAYDLLREDEVSLGLTQLGTFFADEVAQQFHSDDYIPYPREAYAAGPLNPYLDTDPYAASDAAALAVS